jgi:phosphate transport system substrate-binding protein
MGKLTNWKDVGGNESEIKPYVRNPQSGSQEFMEMEVMKDVDIAWFPESPELVSSSMAGAIDAVFEDPAAICYTFYYYYAQVIKPEGVKAIAINRINANEETITNNLYPYAAPVYAVIRSGLDNSSMAYKVYEWLQTESGKQVIRESEYIPN